MPEQSIEVKCKGRVLTFPQHDLRVVAPFGVGLDFKESNWEILGKGDRRRLLGRPNDTGSPGIQVAPTYSWVERGRILRKGEKLRLRFWVVQTDLDRLRARQLIEREHYLMPTGRGMFLACGIEDGERPTEVIGVAVLDTLYHGNPRVGRSLFATDTLGGSDWMEWPRDRVVKTLRIAWASRFAVDTAYQGLGIGTRLAKHLKKVARIFRWPPADFIEVITTEPRSTSRAGHGNFLVSAGYTELDEPMRSSPLRTLNFETGFLDPSPAIKRYYYADLRNEPRS